MRRGGTFVAGLALALAAGDGGAQQTGDPWFSRPFLELFQRQEAGPRLVTESVQIDAGAGKLPGYLVRPTVPERLPALLLAPGEKGLTPELQQSARELAGAGYVTLAVAYDRPPAAAGSPLLRTISEEQAADRLGAAVEWLAAQPFTDPERLGAIGWEASTGRVLRLAARGTLQAAVVSGAGVCAEVQSLPPLKNVPVLILETGGRRDCAALEARLRVAAAGQDSEQTWVEIYEFLGKHVEDARLAAPASPEGQIARIVDIMRVLSSNEGVRGRLAQSLAAPPASEEQWELARSEAAIVAEAGNLLLARRPPKGTASGWRERATAFRSEALTLLHAIERRDFPAAQESLRTMPQTCAACHADYR